MQTRLVTTYEEAKALADAGWPDATNPATMAAGHWYYAALQPGDTPDSADCYAAWENEDGGATELDFLTHNCELFVRAPRLDELLAFLFERCLNVSVDSLRADTVLDISPYAVTVVITENQPYVMFKNDDPLSAIYEATLHVLNSERSPE